MDESVHLSKFGHSLLDDRLGVALRDEVAGGHQRWHMKRFGGRFQRARSPPDEANSCCTGQGPSLGGRLSHTHGQYPSSKRGRETTNIAQTTAGAGDDHHLTGGLQASTLGVDGRVDITVHALGKLEGGSEVIGIDWTLCHFCGTVVMMKRGVKGYGYRTIVWGNRIDEDFWCGD